MKKILFVLSAFLLIASVSVAQRYAVIDSKYILDKIPDYKEAQTKLDQFSEMWQQEIDKKSAELNKMYKDFDAEQIMLSDELKKKREDEL
ncbi:MAG: OmpH family outer membrane protein, partial [Ginsengibacter sp.]